MPWMIHIKESRRHLDCPETGKEIRCTLLSLSSSLSTVTKTHLFIDENVFKILKQTEMSIFSIQPLFSLMGCQLAYVSHRPDCRDTSGTFANSVKFEFSQLKKCETIKKMAKNED